MLIHSSRSSFLLLFYQAAARDRNMLLAEPLGSVTAAQDGYSCGITHDAGTHCLGNTTHGLPGVPALCPQ